ncbi:MAG TPA: aminoglycoside phosphotransferase family protein [Anaerolineae bacterium]
MNPTLEAVVVQATHLPISAIQISPRPPLDYQSNRLYDLWINDQHWIVKEFLHAAEWQEAPRREFRALELLAPLDIAPSPVSYDPALGPVVIYQYMPGEMWDRRRPTPGDLARLADLWLKMNDIPTEGVLPSRGMDRTMAEIETGIRTGFQTYADWTRTVFPAGERAADLCLELLAERRFVIHEIFDRKPHLCFCRADPRFANVIARPDGRLGMVDWEDSGLRDPARDLADLMCHPNQEDLLSSEEWNAFLEPYLGVRSTFDDEIGERMELYLGIFPLFWLSVLLRQGIQRTNTDQLAGWKINHLPANERLRRYLHRGLVWRHPGSNISTHVAFFPDTDKC